MKRITYAETQDKQPFNWRAFLKKPKITSEQWAAAEELARRWTTCSCGSLCSVLPRKFNLGQSDHGEPLDPILAQLGKIENGFSGAIIDRNQKLALNLLDMIELRAAYLLSNLRDDAAKEVETAKARLREIEETLS